MVPCKKEMFKNYEPTDLEVETMEKRLCINMDEVKDYLQVKSPYTDRKERFAFAIHASVCEKAKNDTCAESTEVDKLLENMLFNMYIQEEDVNFGDIHNIGKRPIESQDKLIA
jgi:hypothetical protein